MTEADQAVCDLVESWRNQGNPPEQILEAMARFILDVQERRRAN